MVDEAEKQEIDSTSIHTAPVGLRVRVLDNRSPYPQLASYILSNAPHSGDRLQIHTPSGLVDYEVIQRLFTPIGPDFDMVLFCAPPNMPATPTTSLTDFEKQMEIYAKAGAQIYEKAQAYTNAILLAGYAGVFALLTFAKSLISQTTSGIVVLLVGFSLLVFISWEVVLMVVRAKAAARFEKEITAKPSEVFALQQRHAQEQIRSSAKLHSAWRYILIPTVGAAYAGALLLFYKVAVTLF